MSEGARKGKNFIVVSLYPDICLSPMGPTMVPVPYQIVAYLDEACDVSPNVRFGGKPVILVDQSVVLRSEGNEAGTGGGIKSGTHKGIVEFDEGSTTVRVNGKRVVRHGDECWMNDRNTRGKVICTDGMGMAGPIVIGRPVVDTARLESPDGPVKPPEVNIRGRDAAFSQYHRPSIQRYSNLCMAARDRDAQLSSAVQKRIQFLTGKSEPATGRISADGSPVLLRGNSTECQRRAAVLGPTLRRFNNYREALPYARVASDMNHLGDNPKPPDTSEPKQPKGPCVTRLPVNAATLCRALGLPPGTISAEDLRNDETGFRAAIYRDESSGKLILVARDTQPSSLVDWQTNTRNGDGKDTKQYSAMRNLSRCLSKNKVGYDIAGYSKGGGLAQEAALVNPSAKAFVFNSAGVPDAALQRTGNSDFSSLESRTISFSAQDDFLTYMNDTKDPGKQIDNVKFLRLELEGKNRSAIDPMKIDHRNPALPDAKNDQSFQKDLTNYYKELDDKIERMKADQAAGRPVNAFPPVRAGLRETLPGQSFDSKAEGPNLGKLMQHQMKNVLDPGGCQGSCRLC